MNQLNNQFNILIVGGTGFIGKQVVRILRERGHQVTVTTRQEIDFSNLNQSNQSNQIKIKKLLENQDVVINAIGVMSRHADILEQIHHHAPKQLAQWAQESGVKHWVQLSALGADENHQVNFVGSKGRGDKSLINLNNLSVNIARPSVVFGRDGESCKAFLTMAKLPMIALPNGGQFDFQPVHVWDVAEGLANLADNPRPHGTIINMTGSSQHTLADYLRTLRQVIHHKNPNQFYIMPIPMGFIQPTLPIMNILTNGFISSDSMILLKQGSCADNTDFTALLGRKPLSVHEFIY